MIDFFGKQYLILATSTDIGKTFFVSSICQKLRQKNIAINAIKPIISGFDKNDLENDVFKIMQSLKIANSQENIDKIAPFRLKNPFSPLKASKMEDKTLNFDEIVNFCKENIFEAQKSQKTLLIEGAGGVMTPINNEKTFLDLAFELKIPIILLGGVFLGSISQILCAIEALKSRKIAIEAVIINDFSDFKQNLNAQDIISEVENFSKIKTFAINEII